NWKREQLENVPVEKSEYEKRLEADSIAYTFFMKVNPDTLIIKEDQLKSLIADIFFIYYPKSEENTGPKSIEVKNYYFAPNQDWRTFDSFVSAKSRMRELYSNDQTSRGIFRPNRIYPLPGDTSLLIPFHDTGFEKIDFIFAVFKKSGEDLILQTFLDTIYSASIGGVGIDTIIAMNDSSYFISGYDRGADDGDGWSTVWYAKWDKPNLVSNIYKKSYHYHIMDRKEYKFERALDAEKNMAVISLFERKYIFEEASENGEWEIVDVDTLNYLKFFH
ncbi:MAG TPA: hypothetical protein VHP30_13755, partial [Ignavibacteriales bacterium]|nr:hypothetical protein [Ignavibacteriales bacterium]